MQLELSAWRKARGKSQEEMAKLCDVHVNTWRRWEEHPGEMRFDKALLVVHYLNIGFDNILLPEITTENSI